MSLWTLNYNGTEQDLPTWGIRADFSVELISKGKCVLRLTTTENFDVVSPQFGTWKAPVTLYGNRTSVGSGGSVYFKGYVGKITRIADGPNQGITYEFYDLWWLLERQTFKQVRNNITAIDPTTHDKTYGTPIFSSEIYLGEQVSLAGFLVSLQTNGAECSEVLSWLNECENATRQGNAYIGDASSITVADDVVNFWGRPGQDQWPPSAGLPGGAVDSGNGNAVMDPQNIIPYTRVQTISCAEAIINMLRWSPSVTVQRDFTTSPPTINFRDQLGANALSTVTINLTDYQAKQVQCRAEYERQLPGVIIHYKTTTVINGVPIFGISIDYWPNTITDFTPEALCLFVELSGGNVTITEATIQSVPIANATSATALTEFNFWAEYEPMLAANSNLSDVYFDDGNDDNPNTFTAVSTTAASTTPGSGAAIDLTTYPYVLLPKSSLPSWLNSQGYTAVDAILSIQVHFFKTNTDGLTTVAGARMIHARVKLTNCPPGTYSGKSATGTIDPVPTLGEGGLANQIYNGLSTLSYAGRLTILESQLATSDLTGIVPGAPLELVDPAANTYPNLFIQSVRTRPHFGEIEIEYGPAARLDARDLIELWRCTRERRIYDMPSGRGTGTADAANTSIDQTGDSPVENNSAPPPDNSLQIDYYQTS